MTVQELINKLQEVKNKNLKVVIKIKGSDPIDFIYHNDVEGCDREKVYYEEEDMYKYRFVIDGGMF
jgi:hypothetical protein